MMFKVSTMQNNEMLDTIADNHDFSSPPFKLFIFSVLTNSNMELHFTEIIRHFYFVVYRQ